MNKKELEELIAERDEALIENTVLRLKVMKLDNMILWLHELFNESEGMRRNRENKGLIRV